MKPLNAFLFELFLIACITASVSSIVLQLDAWNKIVSAVLGVGTNLLVVFAMKRLFEAKDLEST